MHRFALALFAPLMLLPLGASALNEGGPPAQCKPDYPAPGKPWVCRSQHNWRTDLFVQMTRLVGFTTDVCIDRPSHVRMDGFVNLVHNNRANYGASQNYASGPVGWSMQISYRYAPTLQLLGPRGGTLDSWQNPLVTWLPGAKASGNIASVQEHYKDALLSGYKWLTDIGCYRFEVWGNSVSDLAPGVDGLISINRNPNGGPDDTYGFFTVTVTPQEQ